MVHVSEFFHKLQDASAYRRGYERDYPPSSYGTSLRIVPEKIGGGYSVVGHRFKLGSV